MLPCLLSLLWVKIQGNYIALCLSKPDNVLELDVSRSLTMATRTYVRTYYAVPCGCTAIYWGPGGRGGEIDWVGDTQILDKAPTY